MVIDIFRSWFSTVLHQGWAGSSETSWISRSRRSGEDIERMPPSQKPAQQGNQSGESGCQQWVILQEKTQQFSFLSLTSNLNPLFLSRGAINPPLFGPSFYVNHLQIKIRSHDASSPSFEIVCQSFKNIRSPSHLLTHCCWAGRCCGDAKARRCSGKIFFKAKQTAVGFTLRDASCGSDSVCWWYGQGGHCYLYSYVFTISFSLINNFRRTGECKW